MQHPGRFDADVSAMRRMFLGVQPPPDCARCWLQAAGEALGEPPWLRWHAPEDVHLTVRFLGAVGAMGEASLVRAAASALAGQAAFALTSGAALWFPEEHRAVALAMSVTPDPRLVLLAERIDRAVRQAGVPPDPRPFWPHITLARLRRNHPPLPAAPQGAPIRFPVRELLLFESRTGGAPVRYHRRHVFPFA
jgi:2'-5' RNA ligase